MSTPCMHISRPTARSRQRCSTGSCASIDREVAPCFQRTNFGTRNRHPSYRLSPTARPRPDLFMTTLLLTHPASLNHLTPPGHPERPDRMRAIAEVLGE